MRKALIGGALLVALISAAPVSAGCWATVGNPRPDAREASPKVTIVNRASGERQSFVAKATDPAAGLYSARVVFPSSGRWSYEVFDGFTTWNGEPAPCAHTHSFASVQIGGPGTAAGGGSGTGQRG